MDAPNYNLSFQDENFNCLATLNETHTEEENQLQVLP